MKTTFVFLAFLASALCATFKVPCGHSFVIQPHKVHAKASASACVSHKASFFFGCMGSNPVVNPVVPVVPVQPEPPVVREPEPPRLPEPQPPRRIEPPVERDPSPPRVPEPQPPRRPESPVREPVVRDPDVRRPIARDPLPPSRPVGPAEVVPVARRTGGGGGGRGGIGGRGNNRRLAMR